MLIVISPIIRQISDEFCIVFEVGIVGIISVVLIVVAALEDTENESCQS